MERQRWTAGLDLLLLLEVALVLLLLGLFIAFYLVPAEEGTLGRPWWRTPVVVGLFFLVLGMEHRRRKRRAKSGLSNALADTRARAGEGRTP